MSTENKMDAKNEKALAYSQKSADELDKLAKNEDTFALFEIAKRFKNNNDMINARKYLILSATLGHDGALACIGKHYENEKDIKTAMSYYKKAFLRGNISVAAKLASYLLKTKEQDAIDILISGAVLGDEECIAMIANYYDEIGDKKEAKYWQEKKFEK